MYIRSHRLPLATLCILYHFENGFSSFSKQVRQMSSLFLHNAQGGWGGIVIFLQIGTRVKPLNVVVRGFSLSGSRYYSMLGCFAVGDEGDSYCNA